MNHSPVASLILSLLLCTATLAQNDSGNRVNPTALPADCYLFTSFRGNGDGLHLAWSTDGINFQPLANDRSYITPTIGGKLMRDPCIIQGPDGTFHLVWTTGWWDKTIGYSSSKDLINWSEQIAIPVMQHEPTAANSWAPEIAYDPDQKQFIIFWATTIPGRFTEGETTGDRGQGGVMLNHRIYSTTTKDFKTFTPTRLFFNPGYSVIDSTLIKVNNSVYMIFKDETLTPPKKHLRVAKSDKWEGPFAVIAEAFTPQGVWAEGPSMIKAGDEYICYFDMYRDRRYGAMKTKDFLTWTNITDQLNFNTRDVRHGTAFKVSRDVMTKLLDVPAAPTAQAAPEPVTLTAVEDIKRLAALVNVEPVLTRPSYNYDEAKANPFPNLPDPLLLKNGQKVTDATTWWEKRRPEILEDFEREVYGRTPKVTPKVTWEVAGATAGTNGDFSVVTKQLIGHVDNSSYPQISVNIQVTLTTPANAGGPVPVMMQLGGGGFGGARRGPASAPGAGQPAARRGGPPAGGAPWQQQLLAKGWGYAVLSTNSVQADNGAGLTQGIIGLVNKGQPRKVDDWGALAAWSWGASRALDYFETDPAVNAKQVGLEGHSRWGKATILAMALDQRFAVAYCSSSGEGGAKLHRRNFGQPLNAVTIPEEYHWMAGNFLKYATKWDDLPVDSHELIALCAPRPVFIGAGAANGDRIVDPKGSFMAAVGAAPVYRLLGKKDLGVTEMPEINAAAIDGDLGFRLHDGGHTDAPNWPTFITFASRYFSVQGATAPTNTP